MSLNLPESATKELRMHLKRLKELAELSGDPLIIGEAETAVDMARMSEEFRQMVAETADNMSILERGAEFTTEDQPAQHNNSAVQ